MGRFRTLSLGREGGREERGREDEDRESRQGGREDEKGERREVGWEEGGRIGAERKGGGGWVSQRDRQKKKWLTHNILRIMTPHLVFDTK